MSLSEVFNTLDATDFKYDHLCVRNPRPKIEKADYLF